MDEQSGHALQVADVNPFTGGVGALFGGADEDPVEGDAAAVQGRAVGGTAALDLALERQAARLGEGQDAV